MFISLLIFFYFFFSSIFFPFSFFLLIVFPILSSSFTLLFLLFCFDILAQHGTISNKSYPLRLSPGPSNSVRFTRDNDCYDNNNVNQNISFLVFLLIFLCFSPRALFCNLVHVSVLPQLEIEIPFLSFQISLDFDQFP